MALLRAKALRQHAAIYTPEMDPGGDAPQVDERHTQTLASALARAVDAKDSYTRSHCQTVSQLAALIAAELGFTGDRLARMRLAGLLHDVGKIGVPDVILNKPAALTEDEYRGHAGPLACSATRSCKPPACPKRRDGCATTTSA